MSQQESKLCIFEFQEKLALKIVAAIKNNKPLPVIEIGMGKYFILMRVAELLPTQNIILCCPQTLVQSCERVKKQAGITNISIFGI